MRTPEERAYALLFGDGDANNLAQIIQRKPTVLQTSWVEVVKAFAQSDAEWEEENHRIMMERDPSIE